MMDLQSVPTPRDDFCVRKVGDETVFLTESGNEVLSLNPVGTFVWEQIDGNHTVQDILDIICDEYEVTVEEATADLQNFMAELEKHDLMSVREIDA